MSPDSAQSELSRRMEVTLSALLRTLSSSDYQAHKLLEQTQLPRWSRHPLFFFLGYIAKAEGRVSEQDIRFAEQLIQALKLSRQQRARAINSFQRGKNATILSPTAGLTLMLSHRLWCAPALKVAICLCHAAQLKGRPARPRRYRCEDAIDQTGLPFSVTEAIFRTYAARGWGHSGNIPAQPRNLAQAYTLLGVSRQDPLSAIKRTYQKKRSRCHPDKLAHQQLSAIEEAEAKEYLLRYQQAWEMIKRYH
ncbi:molecular chaperone DjlA [Marinobacter piscensis]|uniref:molecular chaperone DjlA n=1 Tax=Marinobacter piscensis TaxID=1562308 RepID=UPI0011AA2F21|nr:molecular chaperone DjlA [Marinobacter piscensis]